MKRHEVLDARVHVVIELLMIYPGFDMNAVGEQEGKKKKKKKSRHRKKGAEDGEDEGRDSGFTMDTADPRFMNRLVTDDQFHIDQTSGKLKQTTGMKALQQAPYFQF